MNKFKIKTFEIELKFKIKNSNLQFASQIV